jgi:hypothetical protein
MPREIFGQKVSNAERGDEGMTQKERILDYLREGRTLTRLNSWSELGIIEAPARISELRAEGHEIHTKMVVVRNRYGEAVKVAHWYL